MSVNPSCFVLYNKSGNRITDEEFLDTIRDKLDIIAEYSVFNHNNNLQIRMSERIIAQGLTVGNSWYDYKYPAAPEYFVGRKELISEISQHIITGESPQIIQIKSRSGVGKSSLISYLGNHLAQQGLRVDTHDSRDVKSQFDLLYIVSRICHKDIPRDWNEAEMQLRAINENGTKYAIFIDQFESTFLSKDLYDGYEQLALIVDRNKLSNIYIVFGRKNDLITTFDTREISLDRLNQFSKPVVLPDFSPKEAWDLIENISKTFSKPIYKDVKVYVLEFAQGFPWLLKRTMAHVLRLAEEGLKQNTLIASTLRLDELFEEELNVLDEIEKSYLVRIATKLPADFNQIEKEFDDDPKIPVILDKLTQVRLLRLSGTTYDTYNDVFKEYLIYKRLPEFQQLTLYRQTPNAVISSFEKFVDLPSFDLQKATELLNSNETVAYNRIAEMKKVGLIRQGKGIWYIPQSIKDSYNRGHLGQNVREEISSNLIVYQVVKELGEKNTLTTEEIKEIIINRLPHTSASEKTWNTYTSSLISWLLAVKIIAEHGSSYVLNTAKREDIIREIGNLSNSRKRRKSHKSTHQAYFIPTMYFNAFLTGIEDVKSGGKDISDAKMSRINGIIRLLNLDKDVKDITESDIIKAAKLVFGAKDLEDLWNGIVDETSPFTTIRGFLGGDSAGVTTLKINHKIMMSWGRGIGLIP